MIFLYFPHSPEFAQCLLQTAQELVLAPPVVVCHSASDYQAMTDADTMVTSSEALAETLPARHHRWLVGTRGDVQELKQAIGQAARYVPLRLGPKEIMTRILSVSPPPTADRTVLTLDALTKWLESWEPHETTYRCEDPSELCTALAADGIVYTVGGELWLDPATILFDVVVEPISVSPFPIGHLVALQTRAQDKDLRVVAALSPILARTIQQHIQKLNLLTQIIAAKQDWETSVDTLPDPIVMVEHSGMVIRANRAFSFLVNRSVRDIVGASVRTLCESGKHSWWLPSDPIEELRRPLVSFPVSAERFFEVHTLEVGNHRQASIVYLRDVTEERRLHEVIKQRDRLSALGDLAEGIFHDLNNMASNIQPELLIARKSLAGIAAHFASSPPETGGSAHISRDLKYLRESIDGISMATRRLEEVFSNLRQYSRLRHEPTVLAAHAVDLNSMLRALPVLFNARARQNKVTLKLNLGDISFALGHGGELMRVFENLLKNSLDALSNGGQIGISSYSRTDRIVVEITDNGPGIPDALQEKVFETGFSTKTGGGGMGLGLSICRQILEQYNATIAVRSYAGRGCTFVVELLCQPTELEGAGR